VKVQLSPPHSLVPELHSCRGCGCVITLCMVQTLPHLSLCYWVCRLGVARGHVGTRLSRCLCCDGLTSNRLSAAHARCWQGVGVGKVKVIAWTPTPPTLSVCQLARKQRCEKVVPVNRHLSTLPCHVTLPGCNCPSASYAAEHFRLASPQAPAYGRHGRCLLTASCSLLLEDAMHAW
jgi:hypothetical protein